MVGHVCFCTSEVSQIHTNVLLVCRSSEMFSWWNRDVWLSRLKDSSSISVFPRGHRKFACIFSRFNGNFFLKNSENVLSFQFCSFRASQIKTDLSIFFKDLFTPVKGFSAGLKMPWEKGFRATAALKRLSWVYMSVLMLQRLSLSHTHTHTLHYSTWTV